MALQNHVSDSEDSELSVICTSDGKHNSRELSQPESILSHSFRAPSEPSQSGLHHDRNRNEGKSKSKNIQVIVPAPSRPWEYQPFVDSTSVANILAEIRRPTGEASYKIEYEDGREEDVSIQYLIVVLDCCVIGLRDRYRILLGRFQSLL
jgi:chromodomain-helicase-DNA-binding protein 4